MGFRLDTIGTSCDLNEQNYSKGGAYVCKTSKEVASYFRYKLSKSLYINTKFGYDFSRNYGVFNADDKIDLAVTSIYLGDDKTQLNENFADGAIFKMELLYRLYFD